MALKALFFIKLAFLIILIIASTFLGQVDSVFAGFGITPPYVQNDRLTRGSSYEQEILLVRNNPVEDLKVEINVNVPGVDEWITIKPGKEFIFKKGEGRVPIIVSVNVPDDAEYKDYTGKIRIRTSPMELAEGGGVSIALGAQVDVDISVVDKIYDFEVKKVSPSDMEEGFRKWGLFFPAKINLVMKVTNTGNTKFGPTRVQMEIYDFATRELVETTYNTNKIGQIEPFATEDLIAELPSRLSAGRYLAKYTIFKNDDIAKQGEVSLSIAALGSIPGYKGYGFWGLSLGDKLKVSGVFGGVLLVFVLLVFFATKRRRRKKRLSRSKN